VTSGRHRSPAPGDPLSPTSLDFGARALGISVTERDRLEDSLAEAVAHDGPAMVEVMADPNLV